MDIYPLCFEYISLISVLKKEKIRCPLRFIYSLKLIISKSVLEVSFTSRNLPKNMLAITQLQEIQCICKSKCL